LIGLLGELTAGGKHMSIEDRARQQAMAAFKAIDDEAGKAGNPGMIAQITRMIVTIEDDNGETAFAVWRDGSVRRLLGKPMPEMLRELAN
jgi:hypothetical protein